MKPVVAILFGREGSRGLPNKNIQTILGRPSLEYPLMAAKKSKIVSDIYVSTDSKKIEEIASKYDSINLGRPKELCTDDALLEDAIFFAFNQVEKLINDKETFYLILLCNCVTINYKNIIMAHEMLENNNSLDSVTTIAKYNMYSPVRAKQISNSGNLSSFISMELLKNTTDLSCDRDKSIDCYFCDHSFTLSRSKTLINLKNNDYPFKWMGNNVGFIEQLPGGGDIDYQWQVPMAEWWLKEHGFSNE